MRNRVSLLLFCIAICSSVLAGDSVKTKRPKFIATQFTEGFIFPNTKISPGFGSKSPTYSALTLKYGLSARGDRWQDYVYGMPYKGIGVYLPHFSAKDNLGDPFSVFLFQGARLKKFSPCWSLHYEINLGLAFNWQHYDADERRWFMGLGSSTNIHLGGNWYLKWKLSRHWHLHAGVNITHFSNGALRTPNNGINKGSAFVEMVYNIHPNKEEKTLTESGYTPPLFIKNTAHDLALMLTTRTVKLDSVGDTGLRNKYPRHRFKVAGLSYHYLFHNTRRFMFGPGIETVYDESVGADFRGESDPDTGHYLEYFTLGKFSDRFSVGLSLRGELTMPGYSIFTSLGYDVIHKDKIDKSLYQIYGLKVYLFDDLFATFGVRSTNLTRSRYLYLNVGYTFRKLKIKS